MSTLNKKEWLEIVQRAVVNLRGERHKNAVLLRQAVEEQPDGPINIEQVIEVINQTVAHGDTKADAIKMATTLNNKVVATQEMKDMLEEEEILAKKRQREEAEFNDMTIGERADWFKLSDNPVLNVELHKLNQKIKATPGRKKPRNPDKWLQLKKWEMERGGAKIGDIGLMPPELSELMKELIKSRQQNESGFMNVGDIDWDEL